MFDDEGRYSPEADPQYAHEYAVNMFAVTQEASTQLGESLALQALDYLATMRRIEDVEQKLAARQELSTEELRFIYEIDQPIKHYTVNEAGTPISSPRVTSLRKERDFVSDMGQIYPEADHNVIVERLIKSDRSLLAADNLGKLTGLSGETALKLTPEQGEYVAFYFKAFADVDNHELADLFIAHGHTSHLASIIDKLPGVDPFDVAHQLLYMGRGIDVLTYIDKFTGLDHDMFAKALIDTGQSQELVDHINELKDIDYEEIVDLIISAGEGYLLDQDGLCGFHGLSDETKHRVLHRNGQ